MSITHAAVAGPLIEVADYQANHLIGNGTITAAQIASGVVPPLGSATPLVESGSGAAGTATNSSHEDHVHPAASSGGLAASYLGYNTIGASTSLGGGTTSVFVKQITTTGQAILLSIGAYVQMNSLAGTNLTVGVWTNTSSAPDKLIAFGGAGPGNTTSTIVGHNPAGAPVPGWYDIPCSTLLAASTSYWIGVFFTFQGGSWSIFRDTGGSDGIIAETLGAVLSDGAYEGTFTGNSNKYSIRALVLS